MSEQDDAAQKHWVYEGTGAASSGAPAQVAPPGASFTVWGWIFIIVGLITALIGLGYDVSVETGGLYGVPDRVANLSKMQAQLLIFQGGLGAFLFGGLMISTGAIVKAIRSGQTTG